MTRAVSLYCDGGVIGRNPSRDGCTWAWVRVCADGVVRARDSGIITPAMAGLPTLENNLAETAALLFGLETLPAGWRGTAYTDNLNALRRLTTGHKFKGVPPDMVRRVMELRKGRKWSVQLLKGHPTKADLLRGFTSKGVPVSRFNVLVDKMCCEEARRFLDGKSDAA